MPLIRPPVSRGHCRNSSSPRRRGCGRCHGHPRRGADGDGLACDAGQVVVVGSPRGQAKNVNFYDNLHRRYLEVSGAHGNMLFEPAHIRLPGAWSIDKAQHFLLAALASERLSLAGLITHPIEPRHWAAPMRGC